jgi:thiamine-phosphate pyrophosphorylase
MNPSVSMDRNVGTLPTEDQSAQRHISVKHLVVISPERDDPRESAVLEDLLAAGLERYHVRKPHMARAQLEKWLRSLSADSRTRLVLHQHHELAAELSLGGVHFRDEVARGVPAKPRFTGDGSLYLSRSCHDLATLRGALGCHDSVFFGPVFPSLSKSGYGPCDGFPSAELSALLSTRTASERRTSVLALGGITAETAPRALALGFDGVAALGAIWLADDPVRAFEELRSSLIRHVA